MRLWSLHPKHLDPAGLVALWREGLLAQKVLEGKTRGYRHHPQLARFRECSDPLRALRAYLMEVLREAQRRNYSFDGSKVPESKYRGKIPLSAGQLAFERDHLRRKLRKRSPAFYRSNWSETSEAEIHPLFRLVEGPVADWERGAPMDIAKTCKSGKASAFS